MDFELSEHARDELVLRSIPPVILKGLLDQPEQIVEEREGRQAYQSRIDFGGGRIFLVRAIVAVDVTPAIVVTVYRTRRIARYWRLE